LTEREIKIKKLKEKEEKLNKVIDETKKSLDLLESQFQNDNPFFKENQDLKKNVFYILIYNHLILYFIFFYFQIK